MTARLTSSPEEVATRYGVSAKTIYRHLNSGKLRGAKIGSRWLILDEDASAWFDAQCPTSVDASPRTSNARVRRPLARAGGLRSFVTAQGGQA